MHLLLCVLQVLTRTEAPGFGVNAEGRKHYKLSPILEYPPCDTKPKSISLPDRGVVECPSWLTVSAVSEYVEVVGDSTSAAHRYNTLAGRAQLAALAPAGATAPMGAKASLFGRMFRASASSRKAQDFSIRATSMKVELDFAQVQYNKLFLEAALKHLPPELPEDDQTEELKAVDMKIKRWELLSCLY